MLQLRWQTARSRTPSLKRPSCKSLVFAGQLIVRLCAICEVCGTRLRAYGRHDDCERLLANIRELIAGPPMGDLGDNDEDEADKQIAAREPKVDRGKAQGRRGDKDATALIRISDLVPGLRADEIMGAEVRSSDDKIVGEVRNIIFATKDRPTYAIVASGGFFTSGQDSIVVPIQFLKVSQDRGSYF